MTRKLSLAFALITAITSLLAGTVTYLKTQDFVVDDSRKAQAKKVVLAAELDSKFGIVVSGVSQNADGIPAELVQAVKAGKTATYYAQSPQPKVWAGTPSAQGQLFVSEPIEQTKRNLSQLRLAIIIGGVLATTAASLFGMLLANRLSRRLRHASRTAKLVAAGSLDARVNASGNDEIASLSKAIDSLTVSLQQKIERERLFVQDVTHDLKTPLTAMLSASELLGNSRPEQIVKERVTALIALVDNLLEIARAEQPATISSTNVKKSLLNLTGQYANVRFEIDENLTVQSDHRRLERIVANLLSNAVKHGSPPVIVSADSYALTVKDAGPGFPNELLQRGPQRFWMADQSRLNGHGLGLAIAAQYAESLGHQLKFENEGGAVAKLIWQPQLGQT